MCRVTSDVIRGMGVTQFVGFGTYLGIDNKVGGVESDAVNFKNLLQEEDDRVAVIESLHKGVNMVIFPASFSREKGVFTASWKESA